MVNGLLYRYGVLFITAFLLWLPGVCLMIPARSNPAVSASENQPMPLLGVVKGAENADQWETISDRLESAEIPYREVNLSRAEDLAAVSILFLPNVQTITAEQLSVLQDWMNRGGRVIASGATGNQSSPGVRWALRSLLGAYWSAALSEPAAMQTIVISSQAWTRGGDTRSRVTGGVLLPTGLSSQPVAVWQNQDESANEATAIMVTQQTLFLGWNWGDENSAAAVDSSWLKAAIARFQTDLANPAPVTTAATTAQGGHGGATPTHPPAHDPAEQIAPSGIPVERSDRPISTIEAMTMRQELENLIGRFESAILLANSATTQVNLQATKSAVRDNPSTQILTTAEEKLTQFKQLIRQKNYGAAREQWLQARQMLWENFPSDRPLDQTEVRAIWLDRGTIVKAGSRQGLAQIFDRLAAAGINTVFLETVNAGYTIYPSKVAPQQNPLTVGWDPLKEGIELAHERNMELHAWVWTFAAGNQVHNRLVNLPENYLGPILAVHPDWANTDLRGNAIPAGQTKPFLDPANPLVRRYLQQLYEEIVTDYDVDGLQLDYIRYPFQEPSVGNVYGYGTAARQQFQQQTGIDPTTIVPDSPQWQQWTDFRVSQINTFVAETSAHLRKLRPDVMLSAAVFAMPKAERVRKLQQNWETWAKRGDVDLIFTMSYAQDTNRFQQLTAPWLSEEADLGSTLVLPGIRLLNLPTAAVMDQIQSLRDLPAGGYALFAAENLDATLQGIFNRTQKAGTPNRPIPYRKPFAAAASRFTALQREWSYLLSQEQLWIRGKELENWRSQSAALTQALDQLAEKPNRQKLRHAKTILSEFRASFGDWMHLQALGQSYQVRTWENRLTALEVMLSYGERRLPRP